MCTRNSRPMPTPIARFTRLTAFSCTPASAIAPSMSTSSDESVTARSAARRSEPVNAAAAAKTAAHAAVRTNAESRWMVRYCSKKGWKMEYTYTLGASVLLSASVSTVHIIGRLASVCSCLQLVFTRQCSCHRAAASMCAGAWSCCVDRTIRKWTTRQVAIAGERMKESARERVCAPW